MPLTPRPSRKGVEQLLAIVTGASDQSVPEVARACVAGLGAQLRMLKAQILEFDRRILAWHRSNETSRRLDANLLPSMVSTKTIRRNIDGMQITIELARGNKEQTLQVLKELIDEIEVGRTAT